MLFLNGLILAVVALSAIVLLAPRLIRVRVWRAMITPLASIIGSGFLVLGPILDASYGRFAPLVMAALCTGAYLYGWAIRFNIAAIDEDAAARGPLVGRIETAASWSLAFAYVISVAYYLNLFGAFGVSLTPVNDREHAKLLTTAVFALILVVGWTRGFKALERMEYVSVSIKLAIILGLLVGLAIFFGGKAVDHSLVFNPPEKTGWPAVALAFGLIVTVQGFETSRYLGAAYKSRTLINSMRLAQGISTAIYMVYIGLLAYVFQRGSLRFSETAIIDMMAVVAPVLPVLLVGAALTAQFSAGVADTSGSGGLVEELTRGRIPTRPAYALLVVAGVVLTWSANVFEIISYASRAFAVYYAMQAAIAALTAARMPGRRPLAVPFAALAVLGAAIVIFGVPVEG